MAVAAELGHGAIDGKGTLAQHMAVDASPMLWSRLMGCCEQMTADAGHVCPMDEVVAGVQPQEAR